jgi:hypothetical protein
VPVVQPHGDWILFHSWNGHALRIGGAGFGGLGSEIWVMKRDGTARTNLTRDTEFHDNFHAYWSPDGRYIAWTALSWNAGEGGNGRSEIRVARFDPRGPSGPRLVDEHVVRPGNGHWTQNKFGDGYRIDQSCVANELRSAIVARLSGVDSIVHIPFDIVPQIRAAAGGFLHDPATYPYDGACGAVGRPSSYAQETRIGRFEE